MPSNGQGQNDSILSNTRHRARYRRILRFAGRHLAVTWWFELVLPRIGLVKVAERTRTKRMSKFARQFHVLALELGGLMIKVGQFMSSRLDILPPEVTAELEGLQDEVPPVPFAEIRALAEVELGVSLEQAFAMVEEFPLAAASLGQAHRAILAPIGVEHTGIKEVVLKVQRPGIDEIVAVDLAALRKVGRWLSRVRLVSDRADTPSLIEEFAVTSLEEIDYMNEAINSERFAADFVDNPLVAVPKIVWERTTRRVLTLEDVTAIKITDGDTLRSVGIDPADVAPVFAEVMFQQLFTTGFFHADPHPGNIFVTPAVDGTDEHPWKLTFIDFGMMGEVPTNTKSSLRKLMIAAATRDGKGMVQAMSGIGVLLESADAKELERGMTQLFARFGGMGFAELREVDPREFREFAMQFGDVIRSLPFQLPENFFLIIRAMSLVSGVSSALDSEFNLWDSVEPFAKQLIRDERGNFVQDIGREAVEVAGITLRLPKRLDSMLTSVEDGTIAVTSPRLERRLDRLERIARRLISAMLFGILLIAGAVLRADDAVFGTVLMATSALPLLHALFAGASRR